MAIPIIKKLHKFFLRLLGDVSPRGVCPLPILLSSVFLTSHLFVIYSCKYNKSFLTRRQADTYVPRMFSTYLSFVFQSPWTFKLFHGGTRKRHVDTAGLRAREMDTGERGVGEGTCFGEGHYAGTRAFGEGRLKPAV